ncbi:hypothetical protein ACNJ7K_15840 [Rhodococcus aetherivorans]
MGRATAQRRVARSRGSLSDSLHCASAVHGFPTPQGISTVR